MRSKITFTIITFFILFQLKAQQAFVGGRIGWLPVVSAINYTMDTLTYLGTSAKIGHLQSSSDHNYIYAGTSIGSAGYTLSLYKINAATKAVVATLPVSYLTVDLEITDDDQFLFWGGSKLVEGVLKHSVYKVNTNTMTVVDSIVNIKNFQFFKIYDNNSFYFEAGSSFTGYKLYKTDFTTHSITDSITLSGGINQFVLNDSKTYLYGINDIPAQLYKINLATQTVDSILQVSGTTGSLYDIILNNDGSKLYLSAQGNSIDDPGIVRVMHTNNLSEITDIPIGYGLGEMAFSPNGKLWCPQSHGQTISIIDTSNNMVVHTFSDNNVAPLYLAFGSGSGSTMSISRSEIDADNIAVFPNPTTSNLSVSFSKNHHYKSLVVVDLYGRVVLKKQVSSPDLLTLDLGDEVAGFYMIHFITSQGKTSAYKILKN